jgi:hypothetical protein
MAASGVPEAAFFVQGEICEANPCTRNYPDVVYRDIG